MRRFDMECSLSNAVDFDRGLLQESCSRSMQRRMDKGKSGCVSQSNRPPRPHLTHIAPHKLCNSSARKMGPSRIMATGYNVEILGRSSSRMDRGKGRCCPRARDQQGAAEPYVGQVRVRTLRDMVEIHVDTVEKYTAMKWKVTIA